MAEQPRPISRWRVPPDTDVPNTWQDGVQSALLYQILDTLKEIDASLRVLRCSNFHSIPRTLTAIERNTKRRPRTKTDANKT